MGNGEAKELTCTTHGHAVRWGHDGGGGVQAVGDKGEKKWDNCNSIINKIYLKNKIYKIIKKNGSLISKLPT